MSSSGRKRETTGWWAARRGSRVRGRKRDLALRGVSAETPGSRTAEPDRGGVPAAVVSTAQGAPIGKRYAYGSMGVGAPFPLNMSTATFHLPSGCFFQTVMYLPSIATGLPPRSWNCMR